MVSNIYCKLNKFDAKTEDISEINSKIIGELPLNLGKLQKLHGDFFPIEATKTNVLGTENVIKAAVANGVKNVIKDIKLYNDEPTFRSIITEIIDIIKNI